uniref:Uncharacterized protein n=1 Tax=Avena sativa TaxID=4498 RepID=A0ACD5WWW6_AVESA
MDPHPTPFRGKKPAPFHSQDPSRAYQFRGLILFTEKRRSVAAPAKNAAPKPKSVATTRGKAAKKSPTGNAISAAGAPQPRPRRVFGTVRSSNSLTEKQASAKLSPPPQQKPAKAAPPPPQKPAKVSPPPPQKTAKVSPPPLQKPSKLSPPPLQKPSKLSPANPVRAARPSRPAAKALKKACPGLDLEAKAKKKSRKVSFQDDTAAPVAAPGSGKKINKASAEDAAGHTPMVPVKAQEKWPAKSVVTETPFFSAQNCSSCTLDKLESASYWLEQICLAESVGKHGVSAAFFCLAFECQAQPFHRIKGELRNYVVRHESASTLTPLFDELRLAHGMAVNQPKFDIDGSEKMDKLITTNIVDKKLDDTTLVHECSDCDYAGEVDMTREVNIVKQGEEEMDQPSFERKLNESFEFDDCEAVIVDRLVKEHSDLEKDVGVEVPCDDEIAQSACRSSVSLKESPVARGSSERQISLDKLSPSARCLSAKRLSSGSPFDKKSPLGSATLKRLTSSCPSYKKSCTKGLSSKRVSSGGRSDEEHNATDSSKVIQEEEPASYALVEPLELKEHGEHAAIGEIH